jgi:hypothetical protein
MKNLFLALVATILFSGVSWGQKEMTKEEARENAAKVMVSFTEALKPIYLESNPSNYQAFLNVLYPTTKPPLTTEANTLLSDAYNYLKNNTSSLAIKRDYNGISLAKAAASVSNKENGIINLDVLFTGSTGDFNPYEGPQSKSGGCNCKWYQVSCLLDCVFGDGVGSQIIQIIIGIIFN